MVKSEVRLFVCGSMSEGMVHYEKVEPYVVKKTEVIAFGQVHRLPVGYHVFTDRELLGEPGIPVRGYLLTLEMPEILSVILDEFHGVRPQAPEKGLHFKKSIRVRDVEGQEHDANVYSFNPKKLTKACERVESGNWENDFCRRPPITANLSERQTQYIKKLAESSGREIVPIDLKLYRELMNLDLIVDKGRRLALTKLGKDAYFYLKK